MAVHQAKLVISAEDRASGPLSKIGTALKNAQAQAEAAARGQAGAAGKVATETGRLTGELARLKAAGDKLGAYRVASTGLDGLADRMRSARADAERAARELAAAQRKIDFFAASKARRSENYPAFVQSGMVGEAQARLRAARAADAAAKGRLTGATTAFVEQRQAVAALGASLTATGVNLTRLGATEKRVAADAGAVNTALERQASLMASAAARADALARAQHGLAAGMAAAGRAQLGQIEASRRMIAGMSAPSRAAATQRAAASAAEQAEAMALAKARAETKADARRALASMGAIALGHKVHEGTRSTLHTYREFDKYNRQTEAFGNFNEAEMDRIISMAIHKSAGTKFNDIQWLEGAKALGGRGVKADSVMAVLPEASNYGQAMSVPLAEAVAALEGSLFAFQRDLSTPEKAGAAARRSADIQVQAAKSFGLTHHDLTQGYVYGAGASASAGLSEEKLLAFVGLGKKLNISGDAQGNAFNTMVGKLLSPDQKAREALAAMGVNIGKFQKMPEKLSVDNFSNLIAQQYGVRLNKGGRQKLGKAFSDQKILTDPAAFAVAVREAVQGQVGVKGAQDAKKIAGAGERFRRNNVLKTDVDGMFNEVMKQIQGGNLALANAVFGPKQARRIMAAMRDQKLWDESVAKIERTPDGKAETVATTMMSGFDGAVSRFENAIKNLETAAGRSWDNGGKGGFLTGFTNATAKAIMALAELPPSVLQVGSGLAWLGGKLATGAGTLGLMGAAVALNTSAASLNVAAARLSAGGAVGGLGGAAGAAGATRGLAAAIGRFALRAGIATAAVTALIDLTNRLVEAGEKGKGLVHGEKAEPISFNPGLPGLPEQPRAEDSPVYSAPVNRGKLTESAREALIARAAEQRAMAERIEAARRQMMEGRDVEGQRGQRFLRNKAADATSARADRMRALAVEKEVPFDIWERARRRDKEFVTNPEGVRGREMMRRDRAADAPAGGAGPEMHGSISIDTSGVDAAHQKVASLSESVTGLSGSVANLGRRVAPQVDTSSIDSATSKAERLLRVIQQLAATADGAASAISGVGRTSYADT